jgi:hypothetical protein
MDVDNGVANGADDKALTDNAGEGVWLPANKPAGCSGRCRTTVAPGRICSPKLTNRGISYSNDFIFKIFTEPIIIPPEFT